MTEPKAYERKQKIFALADEVDETIKSVCAKVKEPDLCPDEYADAVKALAALVEARAKLI